MYAANVVNRIINKSIRIFKESHGLKAFDKRKLGQEDYINEILMESVINKNVEFLISIDDISMVADGLFDYDRGKSKNGILEKIINLAEKWEWFRPILFIVPYNVEVASGRNILCNYNNARKLTHISNFERINILQSSQRNNLITIGMHGFHHNQRNHIGYHPYAEFEFSSVEDDLNKVNNMIAIFDSVGLKSNLFKPPSYGIGHSIKKDFKSVLANVQDIKYAFLSTPNNGLNMQSHQVSHVHETVIENFINVPQNINLCWPVEVLDRIVQNICKVNGIIHLQFHAISTKALEDGISDEIIDKIHFCWKAANKYSNSSVNVKKF